MSIGEAARGESGPFTIGIKSDIDKDKRDDNELKSVQVSMTNAFSFQNFWLHYLHQFAFQWCHRRALHVISLKTYYYSHCGRLFILPYTSITAAKNFTR